MNEQLDEVLDLLLPMPKNQGSYYSKVELARYHAKAKLQRLIVEAKQEYEDDLLSTLDDISNKPWRAARHIRELYEKTSSGISEWYKEVADDWGLLEEFFSNGGMNKVRKLMADPKFNVNYHERIAQLNKELDKIMREKNE